MRGAWVGNSKTATLLGRWINGWINGNRGKNRLNGRDGNDNLRGGGCYNTLNGQARDD